MTEDGARSGPASRRDFLKTTGVGAAGIGLVGAAGTKLSAADDAQPAAPPDPFQVKVDLTVNGKREQLAFDCRATLLDVLRERLRLTGTKKGCDHGACGACTVHVDGKRVLSCLTLAATVTGKAVTTIEGLANGDDLHPVQEAFLRCDAYQCGYCTPGQIMSGTALIDEGHAAGSEEETREWMSGNLCRCGAYMNILAAIRQAAGTIPEADPAEGVMVVSLAADEESSNLEAAK